MKPRSLDSAWGSFRVSGFERGCRVRGLAAEGLWSLGFGFGCSHTTLNPLPKRLCISSCIADFRIESRFATLEKRLGLSGSSAKLHGLGFGLSALSWYSAGGTKFRTSLRA